MSWLSYQFDKILAEIVTREDLHQLLKGYVHRDEFQKLEKKVNANQQNIDALATKLKSDDQIVGQLQTEVATIASGVASLQSSVSSLQSSNVDLQAQIDVLKQQNPALDFTGINAALAAVETDLGTVKTATDAVVTALPPAPPPPPVG
jgi:septal ring factor EnvC (AmiA/AmiB activator)